MNGAEFIVRALIRQGQKTVFGYPGGTVLSLYDSLYRHRKEIRHVRTAHEQGAAHAADGFARASAGIGVCFATSGPGATNLVTGIANAFMDSVPVVFITGNVEHALIGTDSFQEVDIVGMTLGVTKHSWAARSAAMLADAMSRAFGIALGGRKGPVLIDVAKDVLEGDDPVYGEALERIVPYVPDVIGAQGARGALDTPLGGRGECGGLDTGVEAEACVTAGQDVDAGSGGMAGQDVDGAVRLLEEAKRPLIIAGGGAVASGAGGEITKLARKLGAPVCHTLMGTGLMPSGDPLNFGLLGQMASARVRAASDECDLLIVVGARLSNKVADLREFGASGRKLLQIDSDRAEINKVVRADVYIAGDAKAALRGILARSGGIGERKPWCCGVDVRETPGENDEIDAATRTVKKGYVDPADIFDAVRRAAGEGITVATDVGCHQLYTARYFRFEPEDRFITSGGLGTMGFGLGAAVGAQIAAPDRVTVLFTGDGSFLMNLNELSTVRNEGLPLIVVVLRNGQLGMVHEMQRKLCGRRYSQTSLGMKLNISALCRAFGLRGARVRSAAELEAEVRKAVAAREPVVIDVRTILRGV
jgi:acetolactate synthase-1/2/3 large subunit